MIIINYDFVAGDEISYAEGIEKLRNGEDSFNTNCLLFFNTENNAVIFSKSGSYVSVQEILKNDGIYTEKEIRKEHNILKIFLAGGLVWQQAISYCVREKIKEEA